MSTATTTYAPPVVWVESSDPTRPAYRVTLDPLTHRPAHCSCLGYRYRGGCRHLAVAGTIAYRAPLAPHRPTAGEVWEFATQLLNGAAG